MTACIGVIAACFILFAIRGLSNRGADGWSGAVSDIEDLVKAAVLPIVTLILGYYFGKSSKT
jgi:hypothetical protein